MKHIRRKALAVLVLAIAMVATPASAGHREITSSVEGAETSWGTDFPGGGAGGLIQSYKVTEDGVTLDYTSLFVSASTSETSLECTVQTQPTTLVLIGLESATVHGEIAGTCFDFGTETSVPMTMSLGLSFAGVGRSHMMSSKFEEDGMTCGYTQTTRPAASSGTIHFEVPDRGIDVTASPTLDPSYDFLIKAHSWCVFPGPPH